MNTLMLLAAAVSLLSFAQGPDRVAGRPFATRSEVIARRGMACTSHPLATQVALDVLKRGGSAVDAAIAANATLGLMEPTGCGIGGDLFAIVWDAKTKRLYGLNASGHSPAELTLDHFQKAGHEQVPYTGPLPVTVPGCVDGWAELHRRFGKLPLKDVLAPAIAYCRDGFPMTEVIGAYWAAGCRKLADQPNFLTTFAPGGKAPAKGELFRNEALARTYERIAAVGRDAFYRGELAATIDRFCRANGCFLRTEDLAAHASEWVEPVGTNYRGYDVWELPPNTQGIAALQMLNILEGFDLKAMGHNSAAYLHHQIEAKKLAFEDRAKFYADPRFNQIPVAALVSKSYGEMRRKLLDPKRAAMRYDAGNPRLNSGDTIYLTVADADRNMVSLIQSNYGGFGSGLCPDGLGFCLQNRGALFSLKLGEFNTYAPRKRPFHTIIPAFVTRGGKPWLSFGLMGGAMQPQGHVQVLCNLIDFGMNLQEAGDASRWYHEGSSEPTGEIMADGGVVALESGVPDEVRKSLSQMGHRVKALPGIFGGYQAIAYDAVNDVFIGASESRKDGHAAGY